MKDYMDDMDDMEKGRESGDLEAKMEVLKQLHQMATDLLAGDMEAPEKEDDDMMEEMEPEMPGMESVKVMAEDEEGLEEGLDVAKKVLKKKNPFSDMM